MSKDSTPMSAWACGQSDTWSQLKRGFKNLSVEFATLSDKAGTQVCMYLRVTELSQMKHFFKYVKPYFSSGFVSMNGVYSGNFWF